MRKGIKICLVKPILLPLESKSTPDIGVLKKLSKSRLKSIIGQVSSEVDSPEVLETEQLSIYNRIQSSQMNTYVSIE